MNKLMKYLLCLSGICAVLGGAVIIVCLALSAAGMKGFDAPEEYYRQLEKHGVIDQHGVFRMTQNGGAETTGTESGTDHFSAGSAEVEGISARLKNCELDFVSVEDDEDISVSVENNSDKKISMQLKNGVLEIEDQRKTANKNLEITVRVPGNKEFKEVDIQMGAGELNCDRLYAKTFLLEAGAGEVDIERCSILESARIQGGVGEISIGLTGEKTDYNYRITAGVGEITLFDEEYASLGKTLSMNHESDRTITLECGLGEIEIYQAD